MGHAPAIAWLLTALLAELLLLLLLLLWTSLHRRIERRLHLWLPPYARRLKGQRVQAEIAIRNLDGGPIDRQAIACDDLAHLPPFAESVEALAATAKSPTAPAPMRARAVDALAMLLRRQVEDPVVL